MNQLYTTKDAAETLSISPSTIRTWKSRQSDRFIEGTHFVKGDAGSVLWTDAGINELRLIASPDETQAVPPTEEEGGILQRYDTLLDEIADAISPHLMDRLDHKVTQRLVVSVSRKPVNSIAVLQSLGLKPANLSGLLGGSDE